MSDTPSMQDLKDAATKALENVQEVAKTHNSAMARFLEHALRAQAELYRGQLEVVENMVSQLHDANVKNEANSASPAKTRPHSTHGG